MYHWPIPVAASTHRVPPPYPHHQFISTNGSLTCCDNGGCWKSRCQPVGDGDPKDANLCPYPVRLTDCNGDVWYFTETGEFSKVWRANARLTESVPGVANTVDKIVRAVVQGGKTTTDTNAYDYVAAGANAGKVASITFKRLTNPTVGIRRVVYSYYGANEEYGSVGDLRTATEQLLAGTAWVDHETSYFRYFKAGAAGGFEHGLRYALGPEAFARLAEDQQVADPLLATDAQVAKYADHAYEYDADQRVTKSTVRAGLLTYTFAYATSTHADDAVPALATGVDGAVRRIGRTYEIRGMLETVMSYGDTAGTTVVNEVKNGYNNFIQLSAQYQEHAGAVNTGTSPRATYGSANTIRPTAMTYPNGRVLNVNYAATPADKLSRLDGLTFDGTSVAGFDYLGLGTFVRTGYPQPRIQNTLATGTGANRYASLDRFGRGINKLWDKAGTPLVRLQYGYDKSSNRTFRKDLVASSAGQDLDELYRYDGLDQLKMFHRGLLVNGDAAVASPGLQQAWDFDAAGNWTNALGRTCSSRTSTG